MTQWQTHSRLAEVVGAIGQPESSSAVQRVAAMFGTEWTETEERTVAAPARVVGRTRYGSAGELWIRNDLLDAVVIRVGTWDAADLSRWIHRVSSNATLDELSDALGQSPRFSGSPQPYYRLGQHSVTTTFEGTWKEPGHLRQLSVFRGEPGLSVTAANDFCRACGDLLVRPSDGEVDIETTVVRLIAAVKEGMLKQHPLWVRLEDLLPLHRSGLMSSVESQLTCRTCQLITCVTIRRNGSVGFDHVALNEAMRHRLDPIPPVEQWASPERISQAEEGMHYVDHVPGLCFLLQQGEQLYLDVRYIINTMVDDSALIRLTTEERDSYASGGHAWLEQFARQIHDRGPDRPTSLVHGRDLYRNDDRDHWRALVAPAIRDQSWLGQLQQRS